MRAALLIAMQIAAAALGVAVFGYFALGRMMLPTDPTTQTAESLSLMAIGILTAMAILLGLTRRVGPRALIAIAIVTVALGFVAEAVHMASRAAINRQAAAADVRLEKSVQDELAARSRDVDARIAGKQPYAAEEAHAFVDFANSSDLRYRSLPDHSAAALALLQKALDAKLVDPNARIRPRRANATEPEAIFVNFYRERIQPALKYGIRPREWQLLLMLVHADADLTTPEAAPIAADVRKTAVPDQFGKLILQ